MLHIAEGHLRVLGLELGATLTEAEAKYRVLVRMWHPDRFNADPASADEATERLKRINETMSWLRKHESIWSGVTVQPQAQQRSEEPRARETRPPDDPPRAVREKSTSAAGGATAGAGSTSKPPPPPPPVAEPTQRPANMIGLKVLVIAVFAFVLVGIVGNLISGSQPSLPNTSVSRGSDSGLTTRPTTSPSTSSTGTANTQSGTSVRDTTAQGSTPTPRPLPTPVTVPPTSSPSSSSTPTEQAEVVAIEVQLLRSEYETVDSELNRVYQEIRAIAPEDLFIELRDAQRHWIRSRDSYVVDHADYIRGRPTVKGDPESWPEYWQAMSTFTSARIEYLQGWLRYLDGSQEQENAWNGAWVDSYGGVIYAKQLSPSELGFGIAVWRGPTIHYGQMEGVARIEGNTATFFAREDWIDEPSGLVFERDGPTLLVTTFGNVRGFHGARAYFEGTYSRPKPMTDWVSRVVDRLISDDPISFIRWDGEF